MTLTSGTPKFQHDLVGQTFGRLVALRWVGQSKQGEPVWECRCSCENQTLHRARSKDLRKGKVRSCGCLHSESASTNLKRLWREGRAKAKESVRTITLGDRTMTVPEWAAHLNIRYCTLHYRLKAGWSPEKALTSEVKGKN